MIVIECDGRRVEAENEKEARKALARLQREARKAEAERAGKRQLARLRAQAAGYRILHRVASGEAMPRGWTLYVPGHKWACHLFIPVEGETRKDRLNLETGYADLDHYGYDLAGAVCNGAGYAWLVFLRDRDAADRVTCYAVGGEGGELALEDCPGVTMEMFRQTGEAE